MGLPIQIRWIRHNSFGQAAESTGSNILWSLIPDARVSSFQFPNPPGSSFYSFGHLLLTLSKLPSQGDVAAASSSTDHLKLRIAGRARARAKFVLYARTNELASVLNYRAGSAPTPFFSSPR
jgi:hypothetical protein